MPERSRRITITIFLFSIFVFLGIIIFVFMYSTARSSENFSKETTKTSIECTGITFNIVAGSISYADSSLAFTIESFRNTPATAFVVVAGNETRITQLIDFNAMPTRKIKISGIEIKEKFIIYPEGCEDYNMKECSLEDCVTIS